MVFKLTPILIGPPPFAEAWQPLAIKTQARGAASVATARIDLRVRGGFLNPRIPFVVDIIFPIATLSALHPREAVDGLDSLDVLGLLIAELALDPQAQRGAVRDRQEMAVQPPGDHRLRVEGVDQVDALVIGFVAEAVGAVEYDVLRAGAEGGMFEEPPQLDAVPLADRAPALNAVVAGDLGTVRQRSQRPQRDRQRPRDKPVDLEPPVGELLGGMLGIFRRAGHARAVGAEDRRQVGFAELAGERIAG